MDTTHHKSSPTPVVWITGASSGIGKAMALEWAKLNYQVVVSARRKDILDQVADEIRSIGGIAHVVTVDVMDETSIESAVQQIIHTCGRLDITIANAGFGVRGYIKDLSAKDWNRQLQGNVTGLALTIKYALPHLIKTKGRIALIGSIAAYIPNPHAGAYGASKAAVYSIGQTLQIELKGTHVSCTTIHPGFVASEFTRIDNDGQWHPDRQDHRPARLMWPTDKAAKVMVKAILKRKRNYVFTAHGKIIIALQQYFPALVRWIFSKATTPK